MESHAELSKLWHAVCSFATDKYPDLPRARKSIEFGIIYRRYFLIGSKIATRRFPIWNCSIRW